MVAAMLAGGEGRLWGWAADASGDEAADAAGDAAAYAGAAAAVAPPGGRAADVAEDAAADAGMRQRTRGREACGGQRMRRPVGRDATVASLIQLCAEGSVSRGWRECRGGKGCGRQRILQRQGMRRLQRTKRQRKW